MLGGRGLWRNLALALLWAESLPPFAGFRLCSGPALTTRGRHAQRLFCPTWTRVRVGLTWADRPEPFPLRLGARLAGYPARAGLEPTRTLRLPLCPGARVGSVARATLALRGLGSRMCIARVRPDVLNGRLKLRLQLLLRLCSTRCDRCDARVQVTGAVCKRSFESMRCLQAPAARAGVGGPGVLQAPAMRTVTQRRRWRSETAWRRFCCSPLAQPRRRHQPLEGLRGVRRRARRPRRRVMIRGDSSDVCGSA